jgi:hypothetical protein
MVKPVYVTEIGQVVNFPDEATPQQIIAYIDSNYKKPAEAAPPPAPGPDDSSVLGRFGYGFARGFTDVPGGIAALGLPAEEAEKTAAGQFSTEAAKYLEEVFGIDPTKDPTAAQQVAQALGGVFSFLVPYAGQAKALGAIGAGAKAIKASGTVVGAGQGAALGAQQRAETIQQQLASGMEISEEKQLAAQRLDGLIGVSDVLPVAKFFGPITTILSKIPATQAPVVESIIRSRFGRIGAAGLGEGAQEAAAGIASDLMEAGIYNPNVKVGEDMLSSFGVGGAAGSLTQGIIELAMGRKAAPFRQLQKDLAAERMENAASLRQGRITQAAETLRESGVTGPIDIVPEEIDGLNRYVVKTPEGQDIAAFVSESDAANAIDLYKKRTGANVFVREDIKPPQVFPVKIDNEKFNNLDEIKAARDKTLATRKGVEKFINDPKVLKKNADDIKVSEELFAQKVQEDLDKFDVRIKKLNDFLEFAEPKVKKVQPTVSAPTTKVADATTKPSEPVEIPAATPEPVEAEAPATEAPEAPVSEAPEPPIGFREAPTAEISVEEQIAVKEAPLDVEAPAAEPTPEQPVTMRPDATAEQLADLQQELFGKPISIREMTDEQRATYEAERDKRFPPVPITPMSAGQVVGVEAIRRAIPQGKSFTSIPLTPEIAAVQNKIRERLKARIASIAPPDVGLNTPAFIDKGEAYLIRGQERADKSGQYINGIIDVVIGINDPNLSVEKNIEKLMDTLNHEIIHSLRRGRLLRESEWRILSRAVGTTKIPGKKYTYLDKAQSIYTPELSPIYNDPEAVIEEAVAEMYKDWVRKRESPVPTRGLFNRITEFFRRLFRVIRDSEIEKTFGRIESGEVRGREASAEQPSRDEEQEVARFSAAPIGYEPKNTVKAYKLFRQIDGKLYPLFVPFGDKKPIPVGEWLRAEPGVVMPDGKVKARGGGLAYRPGWHAGDLPIATHIGGRTHKNNKLPPDYRKPEEIWAEVEMADDVDWQTVANQRVRITKKGTPDVKTAHITDQVPYGGFYRYKTNSNMTGNWLIGGDMKIVRILSDAEVKQINDAAGVSDLPRLQDLQPDARFSAAPLPTYLEQQNQKIFAPVPNPSFKDMVFDFFGIGPNTVGKTLKLANGRTIELSERTMRNISRRMNVVDRNAYIAHLEKLANEQDTGNFERMVADDSALAALMWRGRSTQINAAMIIKGKLGINYTRPGDILSATMKVTDDPDSFLNIAKILLKPGTIGADGKQEDNRKLFKMYATAKRGIGLKADGKPLPAGITDQYIRETISLVENNYPEVAEAYRMYQRFNKNLLTTAMEAGLISQSELASLTKRMDYYGYYREAYQEDIVPTSSQKTASKFNLREYKGSERGNLINDPLYVMLQNSNFWVDSIAKNIAATKSFHLLSRMGEARLLQTGEQPNRDVGEEDQVMFYMDKGVLKRFAVKDPMLAIALGSDDRIDLGGMMKWLSMPTEWLRESVTRDPGFMFANLARDTMSTWITSGANITPFISTIKGGVVALKSGTSFEALMGRGVVGSYDLAMKDPKDLAATIARRAAPRNVTMVASPRGAINATMSLWDKLGSLSEASDAATRIAVYDAAIAEGMSEAEAALRAIEIMDFSRHGSNQILGILTKLIPFLNARIQGLDVLYQAGKAAGKFAVGAKQSERDNQIGQKFLVRGAILAAISVALEMINEDDEDYQQLETYVKNGNVLIPLKGLGLEGHFIGIPKPFESGLLFSTIPQQFYKTMQGDANTRDNVNLFTTSLVSTLGVNPIPQLLLPAIEVYTNYSFFTGLPLVPEGKSRLATELQYNASTSSLAMMLGGIPLSYNLTSGKFEGISPIVIDKLIGGYGGPLGTYLAQGVSIAMEGFNVGPERLPKDVTQLPIVKRFFIDAESRNPKVVSQAYELYGLVDEANRSFSRLRQMGDVEATMNYLEENRTLLAYKKHVFKLVDGLNKLTARERAIEKDNSMTREQKLEAMRNIREMKISIGMKVAEINKALGR